MSTYVRHLLTHHCSICGQRFQSTSALSLYCNLSCKAKAHRLRDPEHYNAKRRKWKVQERKVKRGQGQTDIKGPETSVAMTFGAWCKERGYNPTTQSYQEAV